MSRLILLACAVVAGLAPIAPALAQDANPIVQIFGGLLKAALVENARKSWQAVDADVRDCVQSRYNVSPDALSQQGIRATDDRVAPYVQSCEQQVEQARIQQQQQQAAAEEQQREAAQQAQAAEEAQRATAEAQKKAQAEAAAEEESRRKVRHDAMVQKYGEQVAQNVLSGTVTKGMTEAEVLDARGQPDRRESFPPDTELWSYGADRVGFFKGIVTHVGH